MIMKTENVLKVFNIINTAKYVKMSDDDKIKIWKICRKLKPIAEKFQEDSRDAADKLKPSEDFEERLKKAQQFQIDMKEGKEYTTLTPKEYNDFIIEFKNYDNLVNKAIKEFADKEVEVNFELLSEDSFGKLMASNEDWTMDQVTILGEFICE